jgi:hypothetical protein
VTLKSSELTVSLDSWVPLCIHASNNPTSYSFARNEYLPDFYLHPVFILLDSKGEVIDSDLNRLHDALSVKDLTSLLNSASKCTGTGLSRSEYMDAAALLTRARDDIGSGKAEEALRKLKRLSMIEKKCGIKQRAMLLEKGIRDEIKFLSNLAATTGKAGATEVTDEILKDVRERYGEAANLSEADNAPRRESHNPPDPDKLQAYYDAFFAAASRDYEGAAAALKSLGDEAAVLSREASELSVTGFSICSMRLHRKGEKEVDHDLRVAFYTGPAAAKQVRIQYYFLADDDAVLTGYEEFTGFEPCSLYRCCAAVSQEMLGNRKVVNARVEVLVDGGTVASSNLKDSTVKWWKAPSPQAILFYSQDNSGWVSSGLTRSGCGIGYPSGDE